MLTISSTPGSLFAQRSLLNISKALSQSLQRLATGYRINRGADDPAGIVLDRQTAGKGDEAAVGMLDVVEAAAGL